MSWRINSNDVYPDLDECLFPSREVAEEIAEAVEECGTEYCSLTIEEADGEPQFDSARDYFDVTWPGYPGPCPEGMDWSDWLAANNVD